jgi:hypothetical protein
MRILSIESFSVKPHFETAIEIALKNKDDGNVVYFVFYNIFYDLKRLPGHLNFSFWQNVRWLRKDNKKVNFFLNKLKKEGVKVQSISFFNFIYFLRAFKYALFHPVDIESLKKYNFDKVNLGIGAVSTYISRCKLENPKIDRFGLTIKKLLFEAALSYQMTNRLLKIVKPDLVYTFNGRFSVENAIVQACIKNKVCIKLHERGANFEKYEIYDFPLHSFKNFEKKIQKYWDESDKKCRNEISINYFNKKREGIDTNWMSFNNFYNNSIILPQTNKKKVVYFSSSDDEFAALDFTDKQPIFSNQRECIQYLISFFNKNKDFLFIVRNHPNISSKHKFDKQYWDSLQGENLILFESTSSVNSYDLIDYADIVLCFNSTIGIEATFWSKPSVLLGLSYYRFLDCTYNPKNIIDFEHLIYSKLVPKKQELCYPYGYFLNTFGCNYKYYKPISFFDGDLLI